MSARIWQSSDWLWSMATFGLVAGAVALVYGRAVDSPFIFDDLESVTGNPSITRLWPPVGDADVPGPLNAPQNSPTCGRPLVNLTFAVNYRLGEIDPRGYHLFNFAVHVLSATLLSAIVRRTLQLGYFGGRFAMAVGPLSIAVALVWAMHPLTSEAVIYVTQRTELMVAFFYLATLYCSLRYWAANPLPPGEGRVRGRFFAGLLSPRPSPQGRGRITWCIAATLCCLAGMASKEVMVSAPVAVLLFERTFIAGSFREALRRSWPLYVGLACGWILLIALNARGPRSGAAGFHHDVSALQWWFTQSRVLLLYLKLAAWPWPLSIHYAIPYLPYAESFPPVLIVMGLALGTALLVYLNRPSGFLLACAWIVLAPTLIVPIVTEIAAERRMYLPLAALVTFLVVGGFYMLEWAIRRVAPATSGDTSRRGALFATVIVSSALCIVGGLVDVRRLAAFADTLTMWRDAALRQPDNPLIEYSLGLTLLREDQLQEAAEHFARAKGLRPDYFEAVNNQGLALARLGRPQEAITCFDEALRLRPDDADAHNNLASLLAKIGRPQEAIAHFERALQVSPDNVSAHFNLANALVSLGRGQEAVPHFEEALRLKPDDLETQTNLGAALVGLGRSQEALKHFDAVLKNQPHSADAHNNVGSALSELGRAQDALEYFQTAVQLRPDYVDAWGNLADAQAHLNHFPEAIATAEKALDFARGQSKAAIAAELESRLKNYRAGRVSDAKEATTPPRGP